MNILMILFFAQSKLWKPIPILPNCTDKYLKSISYFQIQVCNVHLESVSVFEINICSLHLGSFRICFNT